jgi:hypothetical protein
MSINRRYYYIIKHPLSYFPQGGKVVFGHLPPLGESLPRFGGGREGGIN